MISFKNHCIDKRVIKVEDFDQPIFEASKDLMSEIKNLLKGDKEALKMKKDAIKSKDNVPDYLDYIYFKYEKDIEKLSKKYKADYDDIAKAFLEV